MRRRLYQIPKDINIYQLVSSLNFYVNVNMNLSSISSAPLIICLFLTITAATHNPGFPLMGEVSVNCGSTETSAALDGREWIGDQNRKISSSLQVKGSSTSSSIVGQSRIFADPVPYKTARISRTRFSYEFRLDPGQKLIRLHFSPFSYRGFKEFKDLFTVEAGPFTLLSNFSASLTADALGVNSFAKEFCVSIQENKPFHIIFSPDQSVQSRDAIYAFINGIEIISLPTHLSYFHHGDPGVQVVGHKSPVHIDNNTALEIIHRQNIKPSDDFVNMYRMGASIAKQYPKKINNINWKILVDVGFKYLVRIHFCELGLKMAETGKVIFDILINEIIANTNIDLVKERNDSNTLWYRDYMVTIQGRKQEGKRHLLISLQSTDEFMDRNGPLKGFEILKLNNPDNSLASTNPLPSAHDSPSLTLQNILRVFGYRNAIASATITLIALVNVVVYKLRKILASNSTEEEKKPSARAQRLCRRFSLAEIQSATKDFNSELVIGNGGFGKVYKGLIDNGQETVAIKRLKFSSNQGEHEFWTEIETLSELRHLNLVSLIGYSDEQQEMILVYDYMTCGSLADHLYKKSKDNNHSSLSWTQLLNICIGAGRGLDYLHTGQGIIHRDVKASNILLDENFMAKVSDFGLAKPENRSTLQSHVNTNVKGTYGYLDPYYSRTGKLTRKSDTYAFGVVLLEVLCGRPAVDPRAEEDMRSLTSWARENISKGELEGIISSNLRGEISPGSLKAFVGVTESCLDDEPKKRPTMAQVVLQLEFALEQQESLKSLEPNEIGVADVVPSTDETISSASTGKLKSMGPTANQNVASPRNEQTVKEIVNAEPPSGETDDGTTRTGDVFGQLAKTSSKRDSETLILAEDYATEVTATKVGQVTSEAATSKFSYSIGGGSGGHTYKEVAGKRNSRSKYGRAMAYAVSFVISPWRRRVKEPANTSVSKSSWFQSSTWLRPTKKTSAPGLTLPLDLCRHFLFKEIISATNNFDEGFLLGKGGFGNVYKGYIDNGHGKTALAMKRLNTSSSQGNTEFRTEIEILSRIRHRNSVSLIGYCDEKGEMILVYEYMARGTLRDHLYNTNNPPLPWSDRLQICIGAAKGLDYLHSGVQPEIIHRDVKSTNILLDENWVAKVADFGLSKPGPMDEDTHVSTQVKGTLGYLDPEYFRTAQLTYKSDVYAFGVVLLEVLCGRPPIDQRKRREQGYNLVVWAIDCYEEGNVEEIIDPNLVGKIEPQCLKNYAETAMKCLCFDATKRPPMRDVVWNLEFAMKLQEAAENGGGDSSGCGTSAVRPLLFPWPNTTNGEETYSSDSTGVFSQITTPIGFLPNHDSNRF